MTGGLSRLRRLWVLLVLPAILCSALPARSGADSADPSAQITLMVRVPRNPSLRYGVDAIQQVVRSTDGGSSWSAVFSPGDAQAPDPSTPGACLPGTYDRVTFLAIDPLTPLGLFIGTEGVLGDYLDNGCGNAPGGLFYSPTGLAPFTAVNSGLPANADARGGGVAWGVQSIAFDPKNKQTMYVQTDSSFLAVRGAGSPTYPTGPGIYRSQDGGAQWDPAFNGIAVTQCQFGPCRYPGSLAIHPVQPAVLLFAAPTGLYRTTNRGISWQLTAPLQVSDRTKLLARIDPYQPSIVYVATDKALYRSSDGGLHLTQLQAGSVPDPNSVVDISFTNHNPAQVVYVLSDGRQDVRNDIGQVSVTVAVSTTHIPVPSTPTASPTAVPSRTPRPTATTKPKPSSTARPKATATARPSATTRPKATATARPTETIRPTAAATAKPRATKRRTASPTSTASPTPTPRTTPVPSPTAAVSAITTDPAGMRDEWPMVGHDPGQSFADPAASMSAGSVGKLHLRWVMAGASPAIEAGGTLYALTSDQKVLALNPQTGAITHQYLSTKVQGLAHAGHLIYFNLGTEIRYVDDKTAAWNHTATDKQGTVLNAFTSLVVSGNTLLTGINVQSGSFVERVYAFDAATGKTIWSIQGNLSSVPAVVGNSVYLGFGGFGSGDTDVIDAATGKVLKVLHGLGTAQWHGGGNRLYASVLHGSGNNLTASVRAYTLSGKLLWVGHDVLFGAALPDRMFGVTPDAIDARSAVDGHRLWKRSIPGLHAIAPGSVVIAGKLLLIQAQSGSISILNAETGVLLGVLRPPTSGMIAGNLLVGDGLIFESVTAKALSGKPTKPELLAFGL
jgi:outer membrane protein assembly factor BamB